MSLRSPRALEEAQKKTPSSQSTLQAQMDKSHDSLVGFENNPFSKRCHRQPIHPKFGFVEQVHTMTHERTQLAADMDGPTFAVCGTIDIRSQRLTTSA